MMMAKELEKDKNSFDKISASKKDIDISDSPDEIIKKAKADIERAAEEQKVLKQALDNIGALQDIVERKNYASKMFWLVIVWLIGILGILILQGFELWGFQLDDKVLIALIGGATANIIGIFAIVVRYFYRNR